MGEGNHRAPGSQPAGRASGGKRAQSRPGPSVDVETLHPVAQRAEGDAQQLRRGGAVVAGLLERALDRLALDLVEIVGQRFRNAVVGRLNARCD